MDVAGTWYSYSPGPHHDGSYASCCQERHDAARAENKDEFPNGHTGSPHR